jgi:hypothetical protein
MVVSSAGLAPESYCTENYGLVLMSERAPNFKNQTIVRLKKTKGKIRSCASKGCPAPRQTGRLTVGRNIYINNNNEPQLEIDN